MLNYYTFTVDGITHDPNEWTVSHSDDNPTITINSPSGVIWEFTNDFLTNDEVWIARAISNLCTDFLSSN